MHRLLSASLLLLLLLGMPLAACNTYEALGPCDGCEEDTLQPETSMEALLSEDASPTVERAQ